MFKWIGAKYGGFERTQEGETLEGGCTTGRRIEPMRGRKGKSTKLEIDLIDIQDKLTRVQSDSLWE